MVLQNGVAVQTHARVYGLITAEESHYLLFVKVGVRERRYYGVVVGEDNERKLTAGNFYILVGRESMLTVVLAVGMSVEAVDALDVGKHIQEGGGIELMALLEGAEELSGMLAV